MSHVIYQRREHAAHTGPGEGWDLEQWSYPQPERTPSPKDVPTNATYHSGAVIDGVQWWTYVRKAPLSPGKCSRCIESARVAPPSSRRA